MALHTILCVVLAKRAPKLGSCTPNQFNELKTRWINNVPKLDHIFIWLGRAPSHTSFIARSFGPHMCGNSPSLGTNVTISCQNYKYSSWHHFHYSQVNRWSSFTRQQSLLAQATWPGIVTLVPNEEEFPLKCGQNNQTMKEVWVGLDQAEWRCDVARAINNQPII